MIIIVIIAIALLVILIILFVFFKKRRDHQEEKEQGVSNHDTSAHARSSDFEAGVRRTSSRNDSLQDH